MKKGRQMHIGMKMFDYKMIGDISKYVVILSSGTIILI